MYRKVLVKRVLVLFMAATLILTQPAITLAADAVPAKESGEEIILDEEFSEEETETGEDESQEEKEPSEEESETTEGESELSKEDAQERETTEETQEESELAEEEAVAIFPGLDESVTLTTEAYESKDRLLAHSDEWDEMTEAVNYVKNQILYKAETKELAEEYAKAYNAKVIDYFYPYVLAELNADDSYEEATVMDALEASLLFKDSLPAVWPNTIYQLEDYESESPVRYTYKDPYADPYNTLNSNMRQWHHNPVGSQIAWANGFAGQNVKVGVIDTGFNDHAELTIGSNRIDVGLGVADDDGHGTHVAGTIAEQGNGEGGCGIAPEVTVYTVKAGTGSGISAGYAIKGIQALQARGVNIINISNGGYFYNEFYEEALNTAYEAGIAVFASAGDGRTTSYHYPSDFKTVISIGALNEALERAYISNHSSRVRYYAPGMNILSLDKDGSSYVNKSGTSMASAVAAGEAVVILSSGLVQGTGKTKVDNLLKLMDKGCVKLSGSDMGKGMVLLTKALGLSDSGTAPKAPVFSEKTGSTFTTLSKDIYLTAEAGCKIYYSLDGKPVTYKNGILSQNAKTYKDKITLKDLRKVTINAICINPSNQLQSKCVKATYSMKTPVSQIAIYTYNGLNSFITGGSIKLQTHIAPEGAVNKKVTWTISPENQGVKIDSTGKVTATTSATTGIYTVKAISVSNPEVFTTYKVFLNPSEKAISEYICEYKSVTFWTSETRTFPPVDVKYNDGTTATSVEDSLRWTSSNSNVLEVDNTKKMIYPKGAGKATLTGYDPMGGGKTVKLTITVNQAIEDITIDETPIKLAAGKSITLKPGLSPSNAKKQKFYYSINPANEGVTISSSGKITASKTAKKMVYTATVSVEQPSSSGEIKIIEKMVYVWVGSWSEAPKLNVSESKVDLLRMDGIDLSLGADPTRKEIKVDTNCSWECQVSPAGIVNVRYDSNSITISTTNKATGTAKITVKTTDRTNLKKTITVHVHNAPSEIRLSTPTGRSEVICYGKTLKLTAVLGNGNGPLDSYGKKITWTSSDPNSFPVNSNGVVTCKTDDATYETITARTVDGKTASIKVYTTDRIVNMVGELRELSDGQLVFRLYADTANNKGFRLRIEAQSSDPKNCPVYVGINNYGKAIYINPKKNGTYTIKVKTLDGSGYTKNLKFKYYNGEGKMNF